jgi:general secretion pathway protein D
LTSAQVLVEVKVLEVELSDQYSIGVDWRSLDVPGGEFGLAFDGGLPGLVRGIVDDGGTDPVNAALGYVGNDQSLFVDALSQFGTVSALASPRMTVLHNQAAILNVAKNFVFFDVGIEPATNIDGVITPATIEASAQSVPEGVIINLTPSIDVDSQTITMAVRPTVTTVFDTVDDPTPALVTEGIKNPVPRLHVQEFDTIIKLNNGQAAVLGGLMQDRSDSTQQGVPVLSEIPMFGGLFRRQQDSVRKSELVVFIKATIIEQGNSVHATDKDLYRTFSHDRRPFKL